MALFIAVDVDPELARDPAASRKLAEVCPVDIFKVGASGALEVIEKNLDEYEADLAAMTRETDFLVLPPDFEVMARKR